MWRAQVTVNAEQERVEVTFFRLLEGESPEAPLHPDVVRGLQGWGFQQQGEDLWVSTWHDTLADHAARAADTLLEVNRSWGKPLLHMISLSNPGHLSWTWVSDDYLERCNLGPQRGIMDSSLFWITMALSQRLGDLDYTVAQAIKSVAEESDEAALRSLSAALKAVTQVEALLEAYRSRLYSRGTH